ncbi:MULTISPECIES: CGNR zinc finger domain-containing protein [unclassified Nesterenkonia]|uniref:CGNR zinc finger domain-containing protein n=1 Tax=unclassified Nesterenkonia TaxID=2629769 RepID=UPI0008733600|nr:MULTISPECIES: CGNR zinc finger domain-containing protein [unclassified Nesterenkonia]MDS2173903.1 CGNR zinc finger domain-containing protein [Nesterenkonia sp. CL21]OSM42576.1 RNA-binding protein [Nesterenkonia sp. PF2B19]
MTFTHDVDVALANAAALVNTAPEVVRAGAAPREGLPNVAALDEFVEQWRWTGSRTHDADELQGVRRFREDLHAVWSMDTEQAVEQVNTWLAEAQALPQLVIHDDFGWHLHATASEAPLWRRMAVEAAMALVDVIRAEELDRLRVCAAQDCAQVLVDLSRNRSRRFCSVTCGNRLAAAAYRSRRG